MSYDDRDNSPPAEVTVLLDCTAPADELEAGDSDTWTRSDGDSWTGRKQGHPVALVWPELVRRFGPLEVPRE